jgi:hypothetical protein
MPRTPLLPLALASLVLSGSALADEREDPQVFTALLLAGPGESLFTRFGHAALRVWGPGRADVVYNYGYADFDAPGLVPRFLRGKVRFWVATQSYPSAVQDYRGEDRSLWIAPLQLLPDRATALAAALERNIRPENRGYTYDHFNDNCATRLRDLLDRVSGGALRRAVDGQWSGSTLRDLVRQGFAGRLEVLLLSELLLGSTLDRPLDRWHAMFLPRILDETLRQTPIAGTPLAEEAQAIHLRQRRSPLDHDPLAAVKILWGATAVFVLLAVLLVVLAGRRSRWSGLLLALPALPVGLCGAMSWALAISSSLPEMRTNELLLVLWPTDLLLIVPAVRWLRGRLYAGNLLRVYSWVRLITSVAVCLAHAAGLLYQQPRAWVVLALALAVGVALGTEALPRRPETGTQKLALPRPLAR